MQDCLIKSTKLLICNLLLFFLISGCYKTKEYQFNVVNLTDLKEIKIKFDINLGCDSKEMKLNLTERNKIKLNKDDFISGYTIWGGCEDFFYPSLFNLTNGGMIDVFIYNRPRVEKEGIIYKITPCESVNEYFLFLLEEDKIMQIISENPVINLEKNDITYIEDPPEILMKEIIDKGFKGGYIVRSSIDNSMLLLN